MPDSKAPVAIEEEDGEEEEGRGEEGEEEGEEKEEDHTVVQTIFVLQ